MSWAVRERQRKRASMNLRNTTRTMITTISTTISGPAMLAANMERFLHRGVDGAPDQAVILPRPCFVPRAGCSLALKATWANARSAERCQQVR